jgi:hypothetical protein
MPTSILLIQSIFVALVIACNLGIYVYIKDLQEEDCSCSQQFKIVKFLKPSTLVAAGILTLNFLSLLSGKSLFEQNLFKNTGGKLISLVVSLYLLAHSICLLVYFYQLTNEPCECSKKKERNLLLYPLILLFLAFVVAIIMIIFLVAGSKFSSRKSVRRTIRNSRN